MVDKIVESTGLNLGLATPQPEVLLTPNIGVIGVGGAGGNTVNNLIQSGLSGISVFAANTDAQALSASLVAEKIQLGQSRTKGLGAGADPAVGKAAAEESAETIKDLLSGLHLLFITAGMGGGTGTGAAPVIAKIAKDLNILTVGVVSKPFNYEGPRRMRIAEKGIVELQKYVDTLIVIPNQNLFRIDDGTMTLANCFKKADEVLCRGVRSITDLIMNTGLINHDFADVKAVLSTQGRCVLGYGEASGENRAQVAAEKAITNPLLDNSSIKGARSLLLNISGGSDMKMNEMDTAAELIRAQVDPDANIIIGSNLDDDTSGIIRVSLVATGIDDLTNPSSDIEVEKPTIPESKPIEIEPLISVAPIEPEQPVSAGVEPELIKTSPSTPASSALLASLDIDPIPDDLVVQLDDSPLQVEPALIDEPTPILAETTSVQDIPDEQPPINIESKKEIENVKPASSGLWGLFHPSRKKPAKPAPKKKPAEPDFLDDLDDFETNIDLPRCLVDPRR